MIMPSLNGKTALVTGASRGMGRASALALASAGAQVLVHYGRGAKEADGVVAEIRKGGGRADAVAMDLAAADGASKLARQARSIIGDRLDILVANAGISKAATIEEMTVEDFDKLFAVNVRAPYFLVQQLLPVLGDGSSVILVSSLGAHAAPRNRLHNQHPPPPASKKREACMGHTHGGSILDADPPAQGVKIARRITPQTSVCDQGIGAYRGRQ